ncbi:RHS repeat-associated core domain-containing protein [Escherichia coli]
MSTGLRFTLEVDGLPPDAFAVVSFHLNQSLSSLFSLDLSLVSQQFLSLEFQQILDKMAYLTIWQGDDVQRRVPGQQYDKESGLYYNRHRYYDPLQGRYITPDPIGLRGGWNMYQYPLNPIQVIDPMGLDAIENMTSGGLIYAVSGVPGLIAANSITNSAYQFGYDMDAIVGGAHNGAADAMRHCYLMCRMTKTFGSTIADVIGKNHEAAGDRQGQPAKERIMDLKNNTVGIACGDFSAKCSDACIEKYNTGQLFGLDGIKADNPIKAKQGSSDASNY